MGQRVTLNLLVWALFGAEFVDEVVLLLLFENVQAAFQVLLDELSGHCSFLLQIIIFLLLGMIADLAESPQARVTQQRSQIDFNCLQEILVVETKHAIEEVLEIDTEHPDLLIVQKSAGFMIKPVLSKGSTEIILHLSNARIMQIKYLSLLALVLDINLKLLLGQELRSQNFKISLEVLDGIIEESSSILNALVEPFI